MKITKADKITPEHGPPTASLDHFWKLMAPRLLDPSSLKIIQALIREKHSLSATHLAARLELGVELVQEQLAAMEREGILVRTPSSGGPLEKAEEEVLYRLGEAGGAAPPPQQTLAESRGR
jgi:DNA-binding transcriptional ArsR family regulator